MAVATKRQPAKLKPRGSSEARLSRERLDAADSMIEQAAKTAARPAIVVPIPAAQLRISVPAHESMSDVIETHNNACGELHARYLSEQAPADIDIVTITIAELQQEQRLRCESRLKSLQTCWSLGVAADELLRQSQKAWSAEFRKRAEGREAVMDEARQGLLKMGYDSLDSRRLKGAINTSPKVVEHTRHTDEALRHSNKCGTALRDLNHVGDEVRRLLQEHVARLRSAIAIS